MPSNEDTAQPDEKKKNQQSREGWIKEKKEAAEKLYSDLHLTTFV